MNGWPLTTRFTRRMRHALSAGLRRGIAFLVASVFGVLLGAPAFAQDQGAAPKGQAPVMQNVFLNVVYGSAVGAAIGFAAALEGSSDKTNPDNARGAAFEGATIGGLIGLGVGIWLVYAGITFESQGSTITQAAPAPASDQVAYQPRDLLPAPGSAAPIDYAAAVAMRDVRPPIALETAAGQPGRIIGLRALVVDLRF